MLVEGLCIMSLMTTNNGQLDIKIDKEQSEKSKGAIYQEYDTSLFTPESETLNQDIKEKEITHQNNIKNSLFTDDAMNSSRLSETKQQLFSKDMNKQQNESDKTHYLQKEEEKNYFPYFLIGLGCFFMIGFIVITLNKMRKREINETT